MIFKPYTIDTMDNNIFKIIKMFNDDLDFACLHKIIDPLELNHEYYFVIYDLTENRFVYYNPSDNKILGDIPNNYLNKGFQYLQEICHPIDFANLVKEIANVVISAMNIKVTIKSINTGQILRTKNRKGEWQNCKVDMIYLKECNKNPFNVLLGFIHPNIKLSTNGKLHITSREKQVFIFLSKGLSAKMIAKTLNISENTVITHRKNLIQKLNVKNSAELIQKGYELSLNY